jgi:hypothetical protein
MDTDNGYLNEYKLTPRIDVLHMNDNNVGVQLLGTAGSKVVQLSTLPNFHISSAMASSITVSQAISELKTAQGRGYRDSNEIVRKGLFVLEQKSGLKMLGEDGK